MLNNIKKKINEKTRTQFLRFICVGVLAFVSEYLSFLLILNIFEKVQNINNISHTISMFLGTIISFCINKIWAFNVRKNTLSQSIKYFLVFIFNLMITNILMTYIATTFNLNPSMVKLLLVCLITCWNFFIYKFFVYR